MTEKFKRLAIEAKLIAPEYNGFDQTKLSPAQQKFAELIVKECLVKIEIEAAQYAEPVWAFELVNDIKEHFGVEP
jgi:hypothetical protein